MAKKYTRKQLHSLHELDKEQERIRNKGRSIEHDFVEILNPQQLALSLLGNIVSRKINGGVSKKSNASGKASAAYGSKAAQGKFSGVVKHPLFKTLLKRAGISFLKWQAFNLALFAGKKIFKAIKEKKRGKKQKVATMAASVKK